jgi:hypothetical protein
VQLMKLVVGQNFQLEDEKAMVPRSQVGWTELVLLIQRVGMQVLTTLVPQVPRMGLRQAQKTLREPKGPREQMIRHFRAQKKGRLMEVVALGPTMLGHLTMQLALALKTPPARWLVR